MKVKADDYYPVTFNAASKKVMQLSLALVELVKV